MKLVLFLLTLPLVAQSTIWPSNAGPSIVDAGGGGPVELGLRFRSDISGTVTGIRFYKSAANIDLHVANLWSSTGALLATATFLGETVSGWQQVSFASPVTITANTVYVASYHTNVSHFSWTANGFSSPMDSPPLHAINSGYLYGNGSAFPSNTYLASNYWVDVVFVPTPPAAPPNALQLPPGPPMLSIQTTGGSSRCAFWAQYPASGFSVVACYSNPTSVLFSATQNIAGTLGMDGSWTFATGTITWQLKPSAAPGAIDYQITNGGPMMTGTF